jgi:DNA-binding HxlR family transcriptional regulator
MAPRQLMEVFEIMADGGRRTLREIAARHGSISEPSISARLRELRRLGYTVNRQRAPSQAWSTPSGSTSIRSRCHG